MHHARQGDEQADALVETGAQDADRPAHAVTDIADRVAVQGTEYRAEVFDFFGDRRIGKAALGRAIAGKGKAQRVDADGR